MVLVIRVDSSTVIGSGHLMRCLTLAGRMQKEHGAEVHFICRDLEGNLSSLVTKAGFNLHLLPGAEHNPRLEGYAAWLTVTQQQDAGECIQVINTIGEQVQRIVVDSYGIDIIWERMLRPYAKEIMVIDDLANRKHDCDYLLDQNEYLDKGTRYTGLVPDNCTLMLGYRYALLREEFYEAKRTLRKRDGIIRNILVFFGGSDLTNETMKTLTALNDMKLDEITINVIAGGSNKNMKQISRYCDMRDNMRCFCQVDNMAEFMAEADLAIGAGGTTTWERLYLDLPSIVISLADNQVKLCEDCARQGYITYLGTTSDTDSADIIDAVQSFLGNTRGRLITNDIQPLYLRKVIDSDCRLLYMWRNDSEARLQSCNQEAVIYDEHCRWFEKALHDKECIIYILMSGSISVGEIRINNIIGKGGKISYSIDSAHRGKGYGKKILELMEEKLKGKCKLLFGQVKASNIPSNKAFLANGYMQREFDKEYYEYQKSLVNWEGE